MITKICEENIRDIRIIHYSDKNVQATVKKGIHL